VYEQCGPNDVSFQGQASVLDINAFHTALRIALVDWKKRHNFSDQPQQA
jgi:hypothetical protein